MTNIVLSNHASEDVNFVLTRIDGSTHVYEATDGPLLGRKRITLSMNAGNNTNRVKYKLELPSVCTDDKNCGVASINYRLVASGDISVVRFSTEEDRQELMALLNSFVAGTALGDLVRDGVFPAR